MWIDVLFISGTSFDVSIIFVSLVAVAIDGVLNLDVFVGLATSASTSFLFTNWHPLCFNDFIPMSSVLKRLMSLTSCCLHPSKYWGLFLFLSCGQK